MSARGLRWLLVGSLCLGAATCGQKGPLELPDEQASAAQWRSPVGGGLAPSLAWSHPTPARRESGFGALRTAMRFKGLQMCPMGRRGASRGVGSEWITRGGSDGLHA